MRHLFGTAAALALVAGGASAGGIDRSGQSVAVLFEEGRHIEFSFGTVDPTVSGVERTIPTTPLSGDSSGDMAPSFNILSGAYKADLNDRLSYALIVDQPFGADVGYPTGTNYYAEGATAELRSTAVTALIGLTTAGNVSVFGGPRYQSMEAVVNLPFVGPAGYTATGDRTWDLGWVAGAAYEVPEIALRLSLTYNSAITHGVATTETGLTALPTPSTTTIETPQSVNFEFQTGIAENTLLFGGARWVEWSKFDISPLVYSSPTAADEPLVEFADNRVTYSLGIGRRLNETWSIAATAGYEETLGGISSNLSPTDGNRSIGVAATYTKDSLQVSGGIRYVWIGDAMTQVSGISPAADFTGNTAVAAGIKVEIKLD